MMPYQEFIAKNLATVDDAAPIEDEALFEVDA